MLNLIRYSLILFACLVATNVWAAPKLFIEQPVFDFGEISQGQTVPHIFKFKNDGDDPLIIDRVRSSCGCTAVLLSDKTLAPGESGEIKANFDSTRFRGAVTKTITLYNNDPVQPVKKLSIKGNIQVLLSVVPSRINLEQVAIGKTATTKLTLENHGDKELRLGEIRTSSPDLTFVLPAETLSAGESAIIDVQLTPRAGQKRFNGYVIIPANGQLKSDLRIPVLADIRQ